MLSVPWYRLVFDDRHIAVNGRSAPIGGLPAPGRHGRLVAPRGLVFLLGDHASVSIDSRAFGPVPVG
jgi:type IV secretory pathway protease TraF